jgi:hypothetical protein
MNLRKSPRGGAHPTVEANTECVPDRYQTTLCTEVRVIVLMRSWDTVRNGTFRLCSGPVPGRGGSILALGLFFLFAPVAYPSVRFLDALDSLQKW